MIPAKLSARQAAPVVERLLGAAVACCEEVEKGSACAEALLENGSNALLAVRAIVKWIERPLTQRWGSPLVGIHAEMRAREERVRERWSKLAEAWVAESRALAASTPPAAPEGGAS